ncbi:MAG: Translation factor pelota [Chaenotheca gracillima]|nr:MAG: Translation factor pelota [Chaenotheca gracillima]
MATIMSSTSRALATSNLRALCPKPHSRAVYQGLQSGQGFSRRRQFHDSTHWSSSSAPPTSRDRGPKSQEDTQTDFSKLNVLGDTPAPATSIDACLPDGFQLDSGLKVVGGNGVLLLSGEAFSWRPWVGRNGRLLNSKGQWECGKEAWGILDLVWPRPDLLILGLGPSMHPVSPETRAHLNSLGIRLEIQDTRNAAAQFNLLATERGVGEVAAALVPTGWKEAQVVR